MSKESIGFLISSFVCSITSSYYKSVSIQLDLVKQTEEGDVSNYQANGEFDLISFDAVKNVITYSCCEEPYPDITYFIRLRRRPMFYVFNLILPCILINCIALLVFYVPSESGEKVTLGISALLSMTVFLMTIRETLPPTEKTPLISMYYGVSICLVTLASGLSVVTLNVYHRGVRGTKVPGFIKAVMLGKLARFLFLQFEPRDKNSRDTKSCGPKVQINCSRSDKWTTMDGESYRYNSPKFIIRHNAHSTTDNAASTTCNNAFEAQFLRMLHRVNVTVERNEIRLSDQELREQTELEWKQVALVMDRLLLWVFIVMTAITTTVILRGSPYGP